jgi:hypothetical protein
MPTTDKFLAVLRKTFLKILPVVISYGIGPGRLGSLSAALFQVTQSAAGELIACSGHPGTGEQLAVASGPATASADICLRFRYLDQVARRVLTGGSGNSTKGIASAGRSLPGPDIVPANQADSKR